MLNKQPTLRGFRSILPIFGMSVVLLGATAYATQGFIQDRRVDRDRAQKLASALDTPGSFPLVINDLVLSWLNHMVGTEESRAQIRQALVRMESYHSDIQKKLDEYQMPSAFLAVPLVEAGFRNREASQNPVGAAGLWQFMEQTARNFGLSVNDDADDRLDVVLESDAAMRYLLANKLRFKDWQLSILSYNAGEEAVQRVINTIHSRDPWTIVRSGQLGQESSNYLPRLMAAILIINNPSLVQ